MTGLLLLCLLLWITLGDEGIDRSSPEADRPTDVSHIRSQGNSSKDGALADGIAAPLPADASHEPIPAPREIAYGGRVLDGDGQPLAGLVPHLWGRAGDRSGENGSFSVPLDPSDIPVSWSGNCLTFSKRGRQYPQVEPKPIGLLGKDEVWIPDVRGPSIQLWWMDTRKPLAGHTVTLSCRRGVAYGRILHTDRTDDEGRYFPYWEQHEYRAHLDVAIDGGTIRYVLDRSHVMAHYPLHLFVPRIDKALYLDIVARTPDGRTVAGAHVDVSLTGGKGGLLSFVTDGQGRGRAYFWLTDREYDLSVATIASWRAVWKTDRGTIRMVERDLGARKRPSVRRAKPFPVVLGHRDLPIHLGWLPVLVRTAGRGKPVRPRSITGEPEAGNVRAALSASWSETPMATLLDEAGRHARDLEILSFTGEADCPDDTRFVIRVILPDLTALEKTVTVGAVRQARDSGTPIVVKVPDPVYCARWIEVHDPDGKPMPFARCFVAVRGPTRGLLTDATGRAFLGRVPADDLCRVVVVDPVTGAGGEIRDLNLKAARKVKTLRLEPARTLQLRIFRPNGAAPGGVSAELVDRTEGRALAPRVRGTITDDNLLTFPPAALSLYDLQIRARNAKPLRMPATAVGETLVLE